ncbi:hypothetical protein CAEBREN_16592 [Caenorhabditis brenneri]|uniref:BTB domain-containing protein n=1 Tax=Caenorhabditis brenneri TaxID=135651 RepID=G0MV25_CAEBE|nr:hypothetical protein CAEBREN_16592 [Caenorhabditis brenneri]
MDADISPPVKRKRVEEDNGNDDEFEQFLALLERKKQEEAAPEESLRRMSFEETEADKVVLVVHGKKFEVSRRMLAKHSPYFMNKFYGDEAEPDKDEIVLINPSSADEFKLFLGTLRKDGYINDQNVGGLLRLAQFWQVRLVKERCVKYLMSCELKSKKETFALAVEFKLESLMSQNPYLFFQRRVLSTIKSMAELNEVIPSDVTDLEQSTMSLVLQKNLELSRLPEPPDVIRSTDMMSDRVREITRLSKEMTLGNYMEWQ